VGRKQRLIFAALILAGIAMITAAGLIGRTNPPDQALRTPGVEGLIPARGSEVLQQQRIGIDLEPGFVVRSFTISDDARCTRPVEVIDFVTLTEGLQQYFYQPDPGKPVEALAPDDNCVKIRIEDLQRPGEFNTVEWAFTVN
jgi:hypothetical protein